MDFLRIRWREGKTKKQPPEIYPSFSTKTCEDLMIRGGKFYAMWDESHHVWTMKQNDVIDMIDAELRAYKDAHPELEKARVLWMDDSDTGSIDKWKKYCEKQTAENFHPLDEKLIFSNMEPKREDYSTKRLPYALAEGPHDAWDELIGTLYSPEEKHKIEWAIGSVVSGDSKTIQKFLVFYGSGGTGKSTVLKIIKDQLFPGYSCAFNAQALCTGTDRFSLEPFKNNPLVAVDNEGDLSRIENNTRLNALVSHDEMVVDQKYANLYSATFNAMLFVGTNKPVKITDSKSGVIRRLIDVRPTGNLLPAERYWKLHDRIQFELGAIACHCLQVYQEDPGYYNDYVPQDMIGATNDFFNFVEEYALEFKKKDQTTLNYAWTQYKAYCQEAQVPFPYAKRIFKEELKSYFRAFYPRKGGKDTRLWNLYEGFRWEKFRYLFDESELPKEEIASGETQEEPKSWIELLIQISQFDIAFKDCPAQYAVPVESGGDKPETTWSRCRTKLQDLDTAKLHYVKVPGDLIVIDFDIKDPETGEKSLERNMEAASKFPKTYVETSKSGGGLHLYYFYEGDVNRLSRLYAKDIEVKVYPKNKLATVRRKLTLCNDIPISTISSGLPLKEESKTVNFDGLKSEKALRTSIMRNLRKEIHADTRSSVDFIYKILSDAYASGLSYDVRNLGPDILSFAARSSHQASYCIKLVSQMKLCSKDILDAENEAAIAALEEYADDEIVFFDVEVFINLFVVVWMKDGGRPVKMINPTAEQIEELCRFKLVGFNCRRYDNHILYARMMDYSNEDLYKLSQRIINSDSVRNSPFFREAYNLSYTDVYDFAAKKQSLKKWEIELDIHHQELGLPWDKPVPPELWQKVADYCVNDVMATQAVFHALRADFTAREILADISGLGVNATTNQHTTQIIFEDDPHPQDQFIYTDLSEMFPGYEFDDRGISQERYLPGTKIVSGKSIYMGEDPGEGGYVYAEPGIYENVALLDIASMHPSSMVALNLFGDLYTRRFADIMKIRLLIKHEQFEEAARLFDGKLEKYLKDKDQAKALAQALKIAINSVYGLTSAKFDNKFRDPRNVDNIVAKRGALFMIKLKHELQDRGYSVVHVKTDSIKIPNATPEVIQFVTEFGKKYGYNFEHEATYEKMCLVNEAVYIAKYKDGRHAGEWTATGTQFQIPFVFKTLFSHEQIEFKDMCETKTVSTALYLDFNENLPDVSELEKQRNKLYKEWQEHPVRDATEMLEGYDMDIAKGHNYVFVGKAGSFCPMKSGAGGGLLMREKDGKYSAVAGTKGYRWMEAETVKAVGKEDLIDLRYYAALVDEAIATISEYGDFEAFAS